MALGNSASRLSSSLFRSTAKHGDPVVGEKEVVVLNIVFFAVFFQPPGIFVGKYMKICYFIEPNSI